jgi:hypothetical protein
VFTQNKKELNPNPHLLHSASAPFLSLFITYSSPDLLLIGEKRKEGFWHKEKLLLF